jgi:autotransporter-associated beta strand protein
MTGGVIEGPYDIRDWGGVVVNASPDTAVINARLNILNGNDVFNVADGAQDIDLLVTNGIGDISWWGGTAGIRKTGDGTMEVQGASNLGSSTSVEAGTLLVNGTLSTTGVAVSSGATLGGTGSISADVDIAAGGTLAPGALGIGTLTISGDVDLDGTLLVDLDGTGGGSSDLLVVTGDLDIGAGTVDFDVGAALDDGVYVFASYGTLTGGAFGTVSGIPDLPAGTGSYVIDYAYGGNNIALVYVPEPATLALVGLGALALLARRRR